MPVAAQSMLNQEEDRLHELCGLDEQSSKLGVPLERLEQEVEDGVQSHVDHIQLSTWIWKVEVSFHLFEDLPRLLPLDLYQGLNVQHLYQEGPVIELGQDWDCFLVVHLGQMVEQLQCECDEQQRAVLATQDFVDLGDQTLSVQSLEQSVYSQLFNLIRSIDIIDVRIAFSSFAIADERVTYLIEKFEH